MIKKALTVVNLHSPILQPKVIFINSKIIKKDNYDKKKWDIKETTKDNIQKFIEMFPEYDNSKLRKSFHELEICEDYDDRT